VPSGSTGIGWNTSASDTRHKSLKKSTKALFEAGREVGLEVNTEETKCMFIFRHQIQDKFVIHCLPVNPLKMWERSNIWEREQGIEIGFIKK
jgi:hypothetical protein